MEEADLLKERLQAITDKRRIQEDIAKKRRQIEEEKLKLQYIKKKALREQWLMDGLSQQSEEEQEAMRLQAQDEQQQSDQLQSNILRIEKEIEALETQELNISANEEVVLKRLKEVEKTSEDIIKKATLAEREADGKELNEGCSTTENHSVPVTMETTEQSRLVMNYEVDVTVADSPEQGNDFSADDEQVCIATAPSDSQREKETLGTLLTDVPTTTFGTELSEAGLLTEMPNQVQKEALILEPGHEELNKKESITLPMSDTLSSADSLYENEAHQKMKDIPEQDPEQEQVPKPEQNPELEQDPKPEQSPEPKEDTKVGLCPEPEQDSKPEQDPKLEQYPEPEQYPGPEQDPEQEYYSEPEQDPDQELYSGPDQDPEQGQYLEPEHAAGDNLNLVDDDYSNLAIHTDENPEAHEFFFNSAITEESILEQCIREEAMSDVSNESCHDPEPDEMDECLRVEIAAASSDSETDEKWRTIFSSSINKEDDDSYLDSLQLSAQELFVQKVEVTDFEGQDNNNFDEVSFAVPQVEEILEQPEDIISSPTPLQEVKYNPLGLQGLSKISEDDSENGRDANHNHQQHINADTTKKLPKDFCVIQETKSENVSTEHVDFQLARKQWREMEEQTRNKIVLPMTKQQSFHGSHSFMYTPVRNIERTHKKAHDLESLNLVGDYPHTQFSPCSEDSGLDDSSYRSPYDDPETLVEKEIRISMEREETFKRERGISRMGKSTDCAPTRSIPRSISTPLTPSFIITSSPTKEPLKHEVSANNVIILDPSNDYSSSPRHSKDNKAVRSGEWRSEDNSSNLIILETSNLIIRSASEFSLNKAYEQPQEKMFLNNPFFKLRSRSTISLVDEEIKMVKQREEELRKERANLYGQDMFSKERVLSNRMDTLAFDNSVDVPVKCKSSPSSPMKTAYRMDRSALSCDHRSNNLREEVEVKEEKEEEEEMKEIL
ncbi:titin isoform X2 [Amphiprion ocellaris]|uniref:titin isoform X2 n=1 Tax=Amphiprion ocellaris TaxID=80972 RepID=UPI0024117F59|nr:titin isoform X2 [Amphiprion ocellaris]